MAEGGKIKSFLFFILKLAVAGAAVWYLFPRGEDAEALKRGLGDFDPRWVAAAAAVYFTHMLVAAWRWGRLARMLGVDLKGFEAVSLTMQGYFFSLVIPGGAIGGDVVKMGVISRRSPSGEKFEGVFTVLMDRITGMIALFGMALVLLPLCRQVLMRVRLPGLPLHEHLQELLMAGVMLLCVAGLAASCVIFFHRQVSRVALFRYLMEFGDRITHGMVSRMTAATDVYSGKWRELLCLIVVSVFGVHLMTAIPVCLLLTALDVPYSVLTVVTALTVGNIVGLIPLFPAGVGGRDVVAVLIMTAGGIPGAEAKTVQLVYTAILLLTSLADGLFFVFDRGGKSGGPAQKETHP
ncbi:MAG: flippase-like domain-containing protein [Lentisphaeria bacterium]|nr:flippase-like domain-containing protein [Lentisphaeria bacterium]